MLDALRSIPSAEQLEDGSFDPDGLMKILLIVLTHTPHWKEILEFTGDSAVQVIECLDSVGVSEPYPLSEFSLRSRSCRPTP